MGHQKAHDVGAEVSLIVWHLFGGQTMDGEVHLPIPNLSLVDEKKMYIICIILTCSGLNLAIFIFWK